MLQIISNDMILHWIYTHLNGMGWTDPPRNLPIMMTRLESLTGDAAAAVEGISPMNEPGTPPLEGTQRQEKMDAYAPNM